MDRNEALDKIAWQKLKGLNRVDATELIIEFFGEPLKPSLREKLNITAIMQWETHQPPDDLQPGNPIYRPILLEKMGQPFRGATNEYLAKYLRKTLKLNVTQIEGELPSWLACPACRFRTFAVIGDWAVCPVCGWTSDPVQEAMPDDPTGANGISLTDARKNFETMGAISQKHLAGLDHEEKEKYPRSTT